MYSAGEECILPDGSVSRPRRVSSAREVCFLIEKSVYCRRFSAREECILPEGSVWCSKGLYGRRGELFLVHKSV